MLFLEGAKLSASFCPQTGALCITDRISGARFAQTPSPEDAEIRRARVEEGTLRYEIALRGGEIVLFAQAQFDSRGDLLLTLCGDFAFTGEIAYPGAFDAAPGDVLLLPMHEGMAFPVDDSNVRVPEVRPVYSGWYHAMRFWAVERGDAWLLMHMEAGIDAVVREGRGADGLMRSQLSWIPRLGHWGGARTLRFMAGTGGLVGAMKGYRALMKEKGLLVTLREKAKRVPNLKKLIGAANFWLWDVDVPKVAAEMRANGIDRALWSRIQSREEVAYLRDTAGFLVGRYDIYRDVPTPQIVARWSPRERDTPEADKTYMLRPYAYPEDTVVDADGNLQECWKVRYADGSELPMACMCGMMYIKHAARDVLRDTLERGYEARFVDTVTAAEFVECYHPGHGCDRETEGKWRLRATEMMCDMGLVTGVEDMMDMAVPYAHYSEGIMSPGTYRRKDAGYYFQEQYYGDDVDDVIRDFQLNPKYRVPLWELVFHDCVVGYWYWGDNSVTCPELTAARDAFNALYGTLPLYSVLGRNWDRMKETVYASYRRATPVARHTGYAEMTDFAYLTADKRVQRTRFENGVTVTANLSDTAYTLENEMQIGPWETVSEGLEACKE